MRAAPRFKINPRDVPPELAARRLGLSIEAFEDLRADLEARGFPIPDVTTGFYDLKAIEAWQDRRSGLAGMSVPAAKDAATVVSGRLARMSHDGRAS
jgi:hypothetical protein